MAKELKHSDIFKVGDVVKFGWTDITGPITKLHGRGIAEVTVTPIGTKGQNLKPRTYRPYLSRCVLVKAAPKK